MPSNLYLRGSTYYGRYSVNGELQRVSLRTGDLREAKARLKAIQKKARDQAFGVEGAAVWEEGVFAYTTGVLEAGGVKPGTAKRYAVSLRQLHGFFAGKPLPLITPSTVSDYVAVRQADGASNATIRRDLTTLSRVLAFARTKKLVNTNAVADFDRSFVAEKQSVIEAPDDEDVAAAAAALEAAGAKDMASLIRFLRGNGLRAGEALAARWQHIKDGNLTILQTKNSRPRTIELDPTTVPPRSGTGRLFPTLPDNSGDLASRWQWLRRGLPKRQQFRIHDLRHAFAIGYLRSGGDVYDLMHHLGHSSIKVTERYLGYVPKARRQVTRVAQRVTQDVSASDTETAGRMGAK